MKYNNPVLRGYADPDVLLYDGVYYLYATSYHIKDGYEVYSSTDLQNWENHGNCMAPEPWGLKKGFWAPDVKEHNGRFYMLATVDGHLGLCMADSPLGPFVPQNGFLLEKTIDGHIFFDGEDMYIYYASWREGHKYAIWGCKMNPDHLTPDMSTETMLIVAEEPYESGKSRIAEAPYMMTKDGKYYLTYSGSHFVSPIYCVAYAESDSPLGPFVKYEGNPILVGDGETVTGTGHHCITTTVDKSEYIIVYHIHSKPNDAGYRDICVGGIRFTEKDGKTILECEKPY